MLPATLQSLPISSKYFFSEMLGSIHSSTLIIVCHPATACQSARLTLNSFVNIAVVLMLTEGPTETRQLPHILLVALSRGSHM